MRISTKVPEAEMKMVRAKDDAKYAMFHMYLLQPLAVGKAQYNKLTREWVTEDGLTFRGASAVEKYIETGLAREGLPLEAGKYTADIVRVSADTNSVVIKLGSGEEIVISSSK